MAVTAVSGGEPGRRGARPPGACCPGDTPGVWGVPVPEGDSDGHSVHLRREACLVGGAYAIAALHGGGAPRRRKAPLPPRWRSAAAELWGAERRDRADVRLRAVRPGIRLRYGEPWVWRRTRTAVVGSGGCSPVRREPRIRLRYGEPWAWRRTRTAVVGPGGCSPVRREPRIRLRYGEPWAWRRDASCGRRGLGDIGRRAVRPGTRLRQGKSRARRRAPVAGGVRVRETLAGASPRSTAPVGGPRVRRPAPAAAAGAGRPGVRDAGEDAMTVRP